MMEAPVALDAPCKGGDLLSDDQVDQLLRQAEERLSAQDFTPPSTHDRPNHQPEQDLSQQDVSDVKEKLGIRLPQQKQVEFKVSCVQKFTPNTLPSDEKAPLRGSVTHGQVRFEQ